MYLPLPYRTAPGQAKTFNMPAPNETAPLLDGPAPNGYATFPSKFKSFIAARGEPGWNSSLRFLLLGSWFNILLVFIPLSFISHHLHWDAGLRFAFSFIAIVPLAKLLGESTEQLAIKCGDTLGGLLNASFGNAVEIIVGVAALVQGELRIVQTSMLGSILSNLLLVLGMSFFVGGVYFMESHFHQTAAQTSSSLMTLACLTLVIPAAYHSAKAAHHQPPNPVFNEAPMEILKALSGEDSSPPAPDDGSKAGLLLISRGTSILLLLVYFAYLYFQLVSHQELFKSDFDDDCSMHQRPYGSDAETAIGQPSVPEEPEEAQMSMVSATVSLLAVTIVTSFCADYLVASIEETAAKYSIPKPFIGVILLPLVSNAAEHVTAVWMSAKGKAELAIGIAVGSSIQIAVFVIPLLILVGWAIDQPLTLYFADFETVTLFVTVLLVNLLIQDGKSNYMEGLMLMTLYIVIAIAFWVS
ncbi:hypothetical protein FRB99_005890 [Tulasnella sp. 403]|nr:hypothetical protein FRB99_005890 [Tulasnella sp. 403]